MMMKMNGYVLYNFIQNAASVCDATFHAELAGMTQDCAGIRRCDGLMFPFSVALAKELFQMCHECHVNQPSLTKLFKHHHHGQ